MTGNAVIRPKNAMGRCLLLFQVHHRRRWGHSLSPHLAIRRARNSHEHALFDLDIICVVRGRGFLSPEVAATDHPSTRRAGLNY